MKTLILVVCITLTGCQTDLSGLIKTLEFGPDECGEFQLTGNIDVGAPVVGTEAHMNLDKRKPCPPSDVD